MNHLIKRYPVKNPILREYIKFFWGIKIDHLQLNHKLIPQRNINLRFNLSDTPHYLIQKSKESALQEVYFSGLHDQYEEASLKLDGHVDVLGISFLPDGFYPFIKVPLSEFKDQILSAEDAGLKIVSTVSDRLKSAQGIPERLDILENELVKTLSKNNPAPDNFRQIFNVVKQRESIQSIHEFCRMQNLGMRKLERMFNKYIGVSANTFTTLNRFQNSMNQLLYSDYTKLSDVAYDNGYFDQMHFIRDFKRFTGNTPAKFIRQRNSILQIGKME
ncbi:MAG TPA: helix-turn-helix domain-containing protein [Lentimicrobium sp.]|nr:helix-turn-helix domain-containing protein [Lentimicrobium sp.]